MLKLLSQPVIALKRIVAPDDLKQRQKDPAVIRLAESYRFTGGEPLYPITVHRQSMRLVAGKDRLAAMLLAGMARGRVQFVSGDEADLRRVTAIENAHRRHGDQAHWIAELAAMEKGDICPQISEGMPCKEPHGAKAAVIRQVAATTGKSEASVKKSIQRTASKSTAALPLVPLQDVVIASFGQPIPKDVQENVNDLDTGLREIRSIIRQAAKKLGELEGVLGHEFIRLREGLRQADYECGAELPTSLCHACKAIPAPRRVCETCGKRGYLGKAMADLNTLPELKEAGEKAGVYYQGQWYSADQARKLR